MFKYKLIFFDETLDTENKSHTISGYLVGAENYVDAISILCKWYGKNDIERIEYIEPVADNEACVELKPTSSFLDVEQHFEEYVW